MSTDHSTGIVEAGQNDSDVESLAVIPVRGHIAPLLIHPYPVGIGRLLQAHPIPIQNGVDDRAPDAGDDHTVGGIEHLIEVVLTPEPALLGQVDHDGPLEDRRLGFNGLADEAHRGVEAHVPECHLRLAAVVVDVALADSRPCVGVLEHPAQHVDPRLLDFPHLVLIEHGRDRGRGRAGSLQGMHGDVPGGRDLRLSHEVVQAEHQVHRLGLAGAGLTEHLQQRELAVEVIEHHASMGRGEPAQHGANHVGRVHLQQALDDLRFLFRALQVAGAQQVAAIHAELLILRLDEVRAALLGFRDVLGDPGHVELLRRGRTFGLDQVEPLSCSCKHSVTFRF